MEPQYADVQCFLHPQFSISACWPCQSLWSPAIELGGAPSTHAQQPTLNSCLYPGAREHSSPGSKQLKLPPSVSSSVVYPVFVRRCTWEK